MKRRRSRPQESWLNRLIKKPSPPPREEKISSSLLRNAESEWEIPKFDSDAASAQDLYVPPEAGDDIRPAFEPKPIKKHRPPWWVGLFVPRRRKIRHKSKPLFVKPVEPEPLRERFQMSRRVMITLNSTIMFLLAFVIMYIVYQMTVIFTANNFGISGVLYYYQIFWPIGNSSPLWFPYYKIILITGSGPFISLIIGLLFFRLLVPSTKNPILKLFYLWIALHALNMFFGAFVAGVTTSDGFGYVALWLRMNIVFRIFFSLVFIFALGTFGYHATRYFLETALSPSFLKPEKRRQFLFYHVLIPSIIGSVIIFLIRMPFNPPYQIIVLATMLAATITAVFNKRARPDRIKNFPKHHGRKLQLGYLFFLVLLMFVFRFGLAYGLHFIIKFNFSVSIFGAMP